VLRAACCVFGACCNIVRDVVFDTLLSGPCAWLHLVFVSCVFCLFSTCLYMCILRAACFVFCSIFITNFIFQIQYALMSQCLFMFTKPFAYTYLFVHLNSCSYVLFVPLQNRTWPSPPLSVWSAEILFQNFQIFYNILLNWAIFVGGVMSKSMQIPNKRIETVGNHVETFWTC